MSASRFLPVLSGMLGGGALFYLLDKEMTRDANAINSSLNRVISDLDPAESVSTNFRIFRIFSFLTAGL